MLELSAIYIYPIKGTRGIVVREANVERRGPAGDRRWMVVDTAGRFLSQRTHPTLALVRPELRGDGLLVKAPEMEPLHVPLPRPGGPRVPVQVWNDTVEVALGGKVAHEWFSRYLGESVRLVHMDDQAVRPVDPDFSVGEDEVSFADGFPLLLTTQASLDDLNSRLPAPLPMNRFRPNVVVSGCAPYAEDRWKQVRIGGVVFDVVKPCARCSVTTIDQETGTSGKEPLRTLARYRRRNGKVFFGQNLIPKGPGVIRAGDRVEVTAVKARAW